MINLIAALVMNFEDSFAHVNIPSIIVVIHRATPRQELRSLLANCSITTSTNELLEITCTD